MLGLPSEAFELLDAVLRDGRPLARWITREGDVWRLTAMPRFYPRPRRRTGWRSTSAPAPTCPWCSTRERRRRVDRPTPRPGGRSREPCRRQGQPVHGPGVDARPRRADGHARPGVRRAEPRRGGDQAGQPVEPGSARRRSDPRRDVDVGREHAAAAGRCRRAGARRDDLGLALPPFLRRVYLEVADGGFGPGVGLLGIDAAVAAYVRLRDGGELPRGRTWPERLLPVVERDPGHYCVDGSTADGRVVDWDPEELGEFSGEKAFARSFTEEAPSVEAWLARGSAARPRPRSTRS